VSIDNYLTLYGTFLELLEHLVMQIWGYGVSCIIRGKKYDVYAKMSVFTEL